MERTLITQLAQCIGKEVKIHGWVETVRDQKRMQFLIVRDRTGAVQVTNDRKQNPGVAEQISCLSIESAVTIHGLVINNPIVKLGGIELQVSELKIEGMSGSPLPIDPFAQTQASIDLRMDWRYLDLRRAENRLIFETQTTLLMAMREYWVERNFIEINSPKIMGSPSESGAELFEIGYFGGKAYLAQSPQFYKQMAMAAGFEGVFEICPVFRADPSFTSRHMTEFTSIDMEMSWIDSHEDIMTFEERLLRFAFQKVKDKHGEAIRTTFNSELVVPDLPFPRIPMGEALRILKSEGYHLPPERKGDLDPGGERVIAKYVKQKYNHDFVFLTDWPITVRPFYHMRRSDNPDLTMSFDLICNGLEITTGAQREHRYEILKSQALGKGLSMESIQFYLDFFKYGCPPHGGFGMGLSRLVMVMLGLNNIREAVFLFRGPNRLHP